MARFAFATTLGDRHFAVGEGVGIDGLAMEGDTSKRRWGEIVKKAFRGAELSAGTGTRFGR